MWWHLKLWRMAGSESQSCTILVEAQDARQFEGAIDAKLIDVSKQIPVVI